MLLANRYNSARLDYRKSSVTTYVLSIFTHSGYVTLRMWLC